MSPTRSRPPETNLMRPEAAPLRNPARRAQAVVPPPPMARTCEWQEHRPIAALGVGPSAAWGRGLRRASSAVQGGAS